jgi:hypothetical protein
MQRSSKCPITSETFLHCCGKVAGSPETAPHCCGRVAGKPETFLHCCGRVAGTSEAFLHYCGRVAGTPEAFLHYCGRVREVDFQIRFLKSDLCLPCKNKKNYANVRKKFFE